MWPEVQDLTPNRILALRAGVVEGQLTIHVRELRAFLALGVHDLSKLEARNQAIDEARRGTSDPQQWIMAGLPGPLQVDNARVARETLATVRVVLA